MASGSKKESKAYSTRVGKIFAPFFFFFLFFFLKKNLLIHFMLTFLHSMISYPNYKFIFPIKALGMYSRRFGDAALLNGE